MKKLRIHRISIFTIAVLFILILGAGHFSDTAAQSSRSTTMYVKDSATGAGDCSSWADACVLNTALTSIIPPGEIWVAAGTYDGPIALATGIAIYGGFPEAGGAWDARDWELNATTLTGNDTTRVVTADGVDNTAILDGFTITEGYNDSIGAGINLEDSNPALSNLQITGNNTSSGFGDGGGMHLTASSPTLTDVTFKSNQSGTRGGGMYVWSGSPILSDVEFINNTSSQGGGLHVFSNSNVTLTDVTFEGNAASIDGGGGISCFGSASSLTNVTFINNRAESDGCGGGFAGRANIISASFTGNTSGGDGGGLCFIGDPGSFDTLSLTNIDFTNNTANKGGGLYTEDLVTITLNDIPFTGNEAASSGGGYYQADGESTLTTIDFSENDAGDHGGGLYGGNNLSDVSFSDNTADGEGGGMRGGGGTITDVTFENNTAGLDGGGMSGGGNLTDVEFSGNHADRAGGGMLGSGTFVRVNFSDNTSGSDGGGMHGYGSFSDVVFSNNSSTAQGGGMYSANDFTLEDVTFADNTAGTNGGGLYGYDSTASTISKTTFSGNAATSGNGGGLVLIQHYDTTGTNLTFSGNTAAQDGGAFYSSQLSVYTIRNATFTANTAGDSGGAIYEYMSVTGTLENSILWGNSPEQIAINSSSPASTISVNHSIIQDGWTGEGNLDVDPELAPLANNGGPTQTHALTLGSPAIDALDPEDCPAVDQRGFTRPIDGDGDEIADCDMGAYEAGEIIIIHFPLVFR